MLSLRCTKRQLPISCHQFAKRFISYEAARLDLLQRNANKTNVCLMGPPGSGKTEVSRRVAAALGKRIIDIDDHHLEPYWGMTVAQKLKQLGDDGFVEAEGEAVRNLAVTDTVISLSGSTPLNAEGMSHLARDGVLIYLDVPRQTIVDRMHKMKVDRIVGQSSLSLETILDKRRPVYEDSYDIRVTVNPGQSIEEISNNVLKRLQEYSSLRPRPFVSTRGGRVDTMPSSGGGGNDSGDDGSFSLSDVLLRGLAPDRGLFLPDPAIKPQVSKAELTQWVQLSYAERALRVLEKFPFQGVHPSSLRRMLTSAYQSFHSPDVLPVRPLERNQYLMEMFYGPTASFKDLSLQFTPLLIDAAAKMDGKEVHSGLLVATSGDTGSAALDGFSRQGAPVAVLFPNDGVSVVQKLQMNCARGNTCVIGVNADFDFCQSVVKDILSSPALLQEFTALVPGLRLSSANSINWARFVPQVVYTFSSYLDLVKTGKISVGDQIDVCIPTGNFGNILGAYYAKTMGLPIRKLICASNSNKILFDFINTGVYDLRKLSLIQTASPSIDILVSSNLERLLYLLSGGNSALIRDLFTQLDRDRYFAIPKPLLAELQKHFVAGWCSEAETLQTIRSTMERTGVLLDPHTAVAKHVADKMSPPSETVPLIIGATAHFAKFPNAIFQAFDQPLSSAHAGDTSQLPAVFKQLKQISKGNWFHPDLDALTKQSVHHTRVSEAKKDVIIKQISDFFRQYGQSLKK